MDAVTVPPGRVMAAVRTVANLRSQCAQSQLNRAPRMRRIGLVTYSLISWVTHKIFYDPGANAVWRDVVGGQWSSRCQGGGVGWGACFNPHMHFNLRGLQPT